jgi:hypothetical protein
MQKHQKKKKQKKFRSKKDVKLDQPPFTPLESEQSSGESNHNNQHLTLVISPSS